MRDLNDLSDFAEVVEHGGYAASRAIGMTRSKLSRHIIEFDQAI